MSLFIGLMSGTSMDGVDAVVLDVGSQPPRLVATHHQSIPAAHREDLAALSAGADSLLLDNRSPSELRALVGRFGDRTLLEASGGVTLESVREIAETGVKRISAGALTHSAPVADVALEVLPPGARA